jgi:hypothetical protein
MPLQLKCPSKRGRNHQIEWIGGLWVEGAIFGWVAGRRNADTVATDDVKLSQRKPWAQLANKRPQNCFYDQSSERALVGLWC